MIEIILDGGEICCKHFSISISEQDFINNYAYNVAYKLRHMMQAYYYEAEKLGREVANRLTLSDYVTATNGKNVYAYRFMHPNIGDIITNAQGYKFTVGEMLLALYNSMDKDSRICSIMHGMALADKIREVAEELVSQKAKKSKKSA